MTRDEFLLRDFLTGWLYDRIFYGDLRQAAFKALGLN